MDVYTINAKHRLLKNGELVRFEAPRIKEGSSMLVRRFLVMHFTEGWSLEGTIEYWRTKEAKGASAHIIIDRDGTVVQCRPFNQTAGHAGVSKWKDPNTGITYRGLNSCSIGIELCNSGSLARNTYPDGMDSLTGKPIPKISARHKNGGPIKRWEVFSDKQMEVTYLVSDAIVARYNLDDVVGHDDIAPDRKEDPGPAFDMVEFRKDLGFHRPL